MTFYSILRSSLLLALRCASPSANAHDEPDAPRRPVPEKEVHRPSARPDRIVLMWTDDPAVSQAVTWRTDVSVTHALAQIGLAIDKAQVSTREVEACTTVLETDLGAAHCHTVEFRDLEPGVFYAYRVGDSFNWSEWFHFRTARSEPAPFTFLYFGDAQNDIRTHWSRVVREAFREAPRAAFTLHTGDLINRAQRDAEWGEWFGAPAWVNATIPVVTTPGNQEYFNLGAGPENERILETKTNGAIKVKVELVNERNAADKVTGYRVKATHADGRTANTSFNAEGHPRSVDAGFTGLTGYTLADLIERTAENQPLRDRIAVPGVRTLSRHWRPQFALPGQGPRGLEESVYYFDYQGTRIISLNSNEQQETQGAWLRGVLVRNPLRWTIITFHHPIFSPAKKRDNPQLREQWKAVFDEFKVDLVLTGHDHTYARSGDMSGQMRVGTANVPKGYNQVYDPKIGTVYVVSVSGPKMYDLSNDSWAVRTAEDTQLFQVISIDGDSLHF